MHSLSNLPFELLTDILTFALSDPRVTPIPIFLTNHLFYNIARECIYTHLYFTSTRSLRHFIDTLKSHSLELPRPRTITLKFSGGAADFEVFILLAWVFRRYASGAMEGLDTNTGSEAPLSLDLDLLNLCLNSHARNPHLRYVYEALSLVNPRTFIWTGPDPEHHFSTAIVPTATSHLFRAMSTWTQIRRIKLTNLSFPSDDLGIKFTLDKPLLPVLPTLRTLYLGQATMVRPNAIAAMICLPGQDNLQSVRLVDAYRESIWGSRIRRSDIEKAAVTLQLGDENTIIPRIRKLVKCEVQTERIMGGDRVEGHATLD
ncbi:hypothetical protein C8Q75DRAFT_456470 [Abortiporus biennis]|nr:hypothetical protein C8Q75DRAFT_456470 [Abortiporus biennis]